jgi:hypothetical protein
MTPQPAQKRYVIEALIGPCSYEEAEAFLERNANDFSLGACWSLSKYDEIPEQLLPHGEVTEVASWDAPQPACSLNPGKGATSLTFLKDET